MAVSKKEYPAIDAKPVVLYGLTSSGSTIAIPILVDANGAIKVSAGSLATTFVKLDQTTPQTTVGGKYWGDPAVDGCWKAEVSGSSLVFYRRESGVWNEKSAITA